MKDSMKDFIKDYASHVPEAPKDELDQIVGRVEGRKRRIRTMIIGVPGLVAAGFALIVMLQPTQRVNEDEATLAAYIDEVLNDTLYEDDYGLEEEWLSVFTDY